MIAPADFLTIALLVGLEALLSADNAMVLAVLVLGLPKHQRQKALRYGIVGAFVFRAAATLLAVYLIRLRWVKLVGAGYLLYLAGRHFFAGTDAQSRRTPPKALPWMGLTPLWATVVKVELTDIVFAIDSILVAVAMSPKRWVILSGGILGIVTMRLGSDVDASRRASAAGRRRVHHRLGTRSCRSLCTPRATSLSSPEVAVAGLIVAIFATAFLHARTQERLTDTDWPPGELRGGGILAMQT